MLLTKRLDTGMEGVEESISYMKILDEIRSEGHVLRWELLQLLMSDLR